MASRLSAIERRLIDTSVRTTNDHPRKKRRRGTDQKDAAPTLEAERFPVSVPQTFSDAESGTFLVRVFSRWIRDPLCRRVVSSQLGSRSRSENLQLSLEASSPPTAAETSPIASPPAIKSLPPLQKRFPSVDDEDFVKYESLKSYVGEMSLTKSSKVHLADGDSVDIVHKSLGEAFEIRKSVKTEEPRIKESRDGEAVSNSFELISESLDHLLGDEAIYPPPLNRPALGPFHLKIPPPLPPPTAPPEVLCRQCPTEDSICFSCEESDEVSSCEWKSDSTSQVELSFASASLVGYDGGSGEGEVGKEAAAKWMVERFKRRLENKRRNSSTSSSSENVFSSLTVGNKEAKNPFCAVPLRVLGRGKSAESNATLRDDICKLAYVEELISLKAKETLPGGGEGGMGNWFKKSAASSDVQPFLCEGKLLSLLVNDRASDVGGSKSSSKDSKSSDFLVTPRFDMTLEEYLPQSNDCSAENRMLLFLQSLEAVAGLHSRDLAHGSVASSNFFLDLHKDGKHRMLLSDFSKTGSLTEDRRRLDSWQLGLLGLQLFDDNVDDEGILNNSAASENFSVDDLPVLSADAPLEMDILVHLLMSNDAARISPTTAANMLHLYFWRNDLRPAAFNASSSSPSKTYESFDLSSQDYQLTKRNALESLGNGSGEKDAAVERDDVKLDLRRSLFQRASFDDILHADEMWKKSRLDLAKFALTGDDRHAELFVDSRS